MKPMGLDRLARRVKAADEYFNKYEYFCFQYKKRYQQVL
jgi:cytochrome c oxidase assembly protein Cox11